jgi:endonuclease YncB( thermonuclease family)
MKRTHLVTVIGLAGVVALLAMPVVAGPEDAQPRAVTAKCIKVIDGDTIIVKCDKRQMTVELEGVDAPELDQPWGKEVRSFVRDMVQGRELQVEIIEAGDGSGTARVMVSGQDLSRLLAERGLAWATGVGELQDLAERARSAPCGIWLDADPVPPWEFREATA